VARPVLVVAGRSRPHEVLLLATSIPLGAGVLLTAPAPQSLTSLMPRWFVLAWAAALAVSGLVGLVAIYWPGPAARKLSAESAALILNGGSLGVFALAAVAASGWRAWFAASYFAAWAAADIIRSLQIRRDLKAIVAAGQS